MPSSTCSEKNEHAPTAARSKKKSPSASHAVSAKAAVFGLCCATCVALMTPVTAAEFGWLGVFDLHDDDTYVWTSQKVGGAYAEPTSLISLHAATANTGDGIEGAEEAIEALWDGATAVTLSPGATGITANVLYNAKFDEASYQSTFAFTVPVSGAYVIAFEHDPDEFEKNMHYLMTSTGETINAGATESADAHAGHDHGGDDDHDDHDDEDMELNTDGMLMALAANSILCLTSLTGLLLLAPGMNKCRETAVIGGAFFKLTSAFASGALLSCAVFLIFPEALAYLGAVEGANEKLTSIRFGVSILGGFLLGAAIHWAAHVLTPGSHNHVAPMIEVEKGEGGKMVQVNAAETSEEKHSCTSWRKWEPITWSILLGDFAHNFVDGVFIAVAFTLCDSSVGWIVLGGTAAHEVPAELSDYLLLTTVGNMTRRSAFFLNFLSGVAAIIGGLVGSLVATSNMTIGVLLAFSGGTYMWVACAEAMPTLMEPKSMREIFWLLSMFLLGATLVGLALLSHEHCAVGDSHEGHNH